MINDWKQIKLEKLLIEKHDFLNIKKDEIYRELTLKLYGKGFEIRREVAGNAFSIEMHNLKEGDFVTSIHQFRNGAIGIIPKSLEGSVLSKNFLVFSINQDLVNPQYLVLYLSSQNIVAHLQKYSSGSATPIYPKKKILAFEIPLPPLPEQKRLVKKIKEIEEKTKSLAKQNDLSFAGADSIIDSYVEKIILVNDKWQRFPLKQKAKINPSKTELNGFGESKEVSFLPMPAVDDKTGTIKAPLIKKYSEVKSGYTYFRDGDVIFAKITPCMENGKSAVCKNLVNTVGFGSTEFHVIRPDTKELLPEWIHLIVRSKKFREEAEKNMPGTAGQKRVPKEFLEDYLFPIPDITEQKAIIEHANKLIQKQGLLKTEISNRSSYILAFTSSVLSKAFNGEL